ncbi:MAG: OB-fold nucleic acid binding domain-containing protein, partial [Sedimentibacter sp.]
MSQASIGDMIDDKAREQMKSMSDKNKNISDLKAGEKADGFYLIKSFEVKKTTNGKQYIDIDLVDKTGEINAKIWDYSKETEAIISENGIVKVRGEVLEWNGTKQLKINKVRGKLPADTIKINDLIPSAPIEPSEMLSEVKSYAKKIKDAEIRLLVENIM